MSGGRHDLSKKRSYAWLRLTADDALDLPVQLGSIVPLPLAVAARFAKVASGKPEYFITDLTYTFLATVLHKELCVMPVLDDDSIRIAPRLWCTPTADTAVANSVKPFQGLRPCADLLTRVSNVELRHMAQWISGVERRCGSQGDVVRL